MVSRSPVLRTALLVLLSEGDSHGYELAPRLAEIGIDPDMAAMYRTLRCMDRDGEVRSAWDSSSRDRPGACTPTETGRRLLARAVEAMEEQRHTLGQLLSRSRRSQPG